LLAFKRQFGHCRVSTLSKTHASLRNWVRTQRSKRRKGNLTEEQIRLLNELNFTWGFPKTTSQDAMKPKVKRMTQAELEQVNRAKWEAMYRALAAYQQEHGHCRIPSKEHPHLSSWMNRQRMAKREGKLRKDRLRRLNTLGFVWSGRAERWEMMLTALMEYKEAYGDCNVPRDWPENPQLSHWVATQRGYERNGRLPSDRKKRLMAIGFRWLPMSTRKPSPG
jgi:hypothetical protein